MDEYQTHQFWEMKPPTVKQTFTYNELKKILDTLDENQLNCPVRWGGEGNSGLIQSVWIVEENQINPSGDGWEPVSAYDNDPEFDMSDEPVVCSKGTPILLAD